MTLPAGNPVTSGTTISTTWANATLTDIATEISDSASRSGKGGFSAPVRVPDGTAAAPAYAFGGEINTGFYRAGTNDVRLTIGGTDALRMVPGAVAVGAAPNPSATLTMGAGFQPAVDFISTAGAAGAKEGRLVYDNGASFGAPAWVFQNISDAGAFVSNGLIVQRDGLVRLANTAALQPAAMVTAITPNAGLTAGGCAYWKDANGMVHLEGSVLNASGGSVTNIASTTPLPAGFRGTANMAAISTIGPVQVSVLATTGAITTAPALANGNQLFLDGLSFRATA